MSDDFAQLGMSAGLYPDGLGEGYVPFDLYAFFRDDPAQLAAHVEVGIVPWWTEPGLHGTVLRPLSSALLSLDHRLTPVTTPGATRIWHLHSLIWLAALIVAAGLALRRLLSPALALLAVALLACEAGLATPVGWLANRCVLIAGCFSFLAIWAHLGWRALEPGDRRRRGWIAAEIGCVIAALAAGEYGLAALAYVLGWELLAADGGWRARARALAPALVPTLAWLLVHRALGYGTSGSAIYVDPLSAPLSWAALALERLPRLAAAAIWSIPADPGDMLRRFGTRWLPGGGGPVAELDVPAFERAHLIACVALVPLAALALSLARRELDAGERRALAALSLGAVLGLVPVTVAPAHARLLVAAQLGACALVAATAVGAVRALRRRPDQAGARAWLRRLAPAPLALVLIYANGPADLRWGQTYLAGLTNMNRSIAAAFTEGDLLTGARADELASREVIVVNALSQTIGLHGQYFLHGQGLPAPRSWRSLAMAELPLIATRPRADALELSTVEGAWLQSQSEWFFRRPDHPLPAGTGFALPGMTVEILDDLDGDPTRVRFGFPAQLDDPRYLWLISTSKGLMRWTPPALGARAAIPRPALPLVGP